MKNKGALKFCFILAGVLNFIVSLWVWFDYDFIFREWMRLPFQDSVYFQMMLRGFLICVMTFGVGYILVGLKPEKNRDLCLVSCLAKAGWPILYLFSCVKYDFFRYGAHPVILLWPALYDLVFIPFFVQLFLAIKRELSVINEES